MRSCDTTCLFHWFAWPYNDCLANPRGIHLSVAHNKLCHELILLSVLSLLDLNICKTCGTVGYGHLIAFPQEKCWGKVDVRDLWKDRRKSSKQGFGWTTLTFIVNVLIRGCGPWGGLAFHHLICWNFYAVIQQRNWGRERENGSVTWQFNAACEPVPAPVINYLYKIKQHPPWSWAEARRDECATTGQPTEPSLIHWPGIHQLKSSASEKEIEMDSSQHR